MKSEQAVLPNPCSEEEEEEEEAIIEDTVTWIISHAYAQIHRRPHTYTCDSMCVSIRVTVYLIIIVLK
jgi:hypothetical protein